METVRDGYRGMEYINVCVCAEREKESKATKIIYRFASFSTMDFRAKRNISSAVLHMKDTLHDTKQTLAPIFINALAY